MKSIILIGITLLNISYLVSQQIPQYSQYVKNPFMINPAAAGLYDAFDANLGGRWQWAGLNNAPFTGYAAASSPLKTRSTPRYSNSVRINEKISRTPEINTGRKKHAFGGIVVADRYGAFQSFYMCGAYALHLPLTKNYNLSFGTKIGFSNNSLIPEKAKVLSETTDYAYQSFFENGNSRNIMDLGAGISIYSKNLFIGVAADHLTKDFVDFGHSFSYFERKMHFNVTAGYKINISSDWSITPAFLVKYMKPSPISVEFTLLTDYKEFLWFGVSYRNKDAIVGMMGLNINSKLRVGYSFDYTTSRINKVSSGGHELLIGIRIGK